MKKIFSKKIIVIFSPLIICIFFFFLLSIIFPLPPLKPYSLIVEDRNGKLLHAFLAEDEMWRLRTSPEEIPEKLKQILIQKEDRYFYYHLGINPFSIIKAFYRNLQSGKKVSGASTITMQVARMLERKERTYFNKIIEMFRALQLELQYSKKEILEMYLSMVPLGGNVEGLKSASLLYYQTPLERLNIAQLFDLILIPNNPNKFRPDKNSEALFAERKRRANIWIKKRFFSSEDSLILWQTPIAVQKIELPKLAPHFSLRIKEKIQNMSEVRSSLDWTIQQSVEKLLTNHLKIWKQKDISNGAVLVIKNSTREILAYCGSENFYDSSSQGQVDVVKAVRSPGSTLKPLLYAQAMEQGILTPKTVLLDVPYDVGGFTAENYEGTFSGAVYTDEALRRSLNVPMMRLLQESGTQEFIKFLKSAKFSSLENQKEKLGLSMIIGGCGVTLEELVTVYSAFPNKGKLFPLQYISHKKRVPTHNEVENIFSSSTAFMVTEILSGLDRPDIPNNFESAINLPKIAFKTGTSYGRRDAWAIGYSAEYTVGVWFGNVTNKGNPTLAGGKVAAPLLVDILNAISSPNQKIILQQPIDIGVRNICVKSGNVPTNNCEHVIEDYYSYSQTVHKMCEIEKEYMISLDGKKYYCQSCVKNNPYKTVIISEYPPELLEFWKKNNSKIQQAPPHNPECERLFTGEGPTIITPTEGMTYFLTSSQQTIPLQATSSTDVSEHIWYCDEKFVGRKKTGEKIFLSLLDGTHTISCMDDKGKISSIKIIVKVVY